MNKCCQLVSMDYERKRHIEILGMRTQVKTLRDNVDREVRQRRNSQ